MNKIVIGILAHVDAGKTTLSEGMLYLSGKIRKLGRVDNKDAYLDNFELERNRGITIFSKQAIFQVEDKVFTLLDTPGHVDFSAEMERTLQVLDYAILVVSASDGVQGHTHTLWKLLERYDIPVFIFVNKMDQNHRDKNKILKELKDRLSSECVEFKKENIEEFYDDIAMCGEDLMEIYLEDGIIGKEEIVDAIYDRRIFPCFFGSALKLNGVEEFMKALFTYTDIPTYSQNFGAKVFKISRDDQGNRLTHMKITGGSLKVKDVLTNDIWKEKVNQIRIYSGEKFETANEVKAGEICAVTGLTMTIPGEGLGVEASSNAPILEPVLSYEVILPEDCDQRIMLPKLREIEEEVPELNIEYNEELSEIKVKVMGDVQIEILQSLIKSRFNVDVEFDSGKIVYKETINNLVEGVGHFEPLRHYAEVHLLLEPEPRGSGLKFNTNCSEDILDKNWQRLVITHLEEKVHRGVLIGAPITDIKITLVSGRSHKKHTEGGDFREAVYRAVRQGLKEAESVILEPYYSFQIELPEKMVGRAMSDIEKMHGVCEILSSQDGITILTGSAPVATMRNYQREIIAYTKGYGRLFCSLKGYDICHNSEEIIDSYGYDSERDLENPTGSVFCSHGSGFLVSWDEVKKYMHLESYLKSANNSKEKNFNRHVPRSEERWISLEEIDQIMDSTFYSNKGNKSSWKKRKTAVESYYEIKNYSLGEKVFKDEYLLVDGYNIIFAWEDLNELSSKSMEDARVKLLDYLCNYRGMKKCEIIVVFDAYAVNGHIEEMIDYNNIHVVYTKEAQTADQYIEKFTNDNKKKYNITVATSDGLQQIIIRGNGANLMSARELKNEINMVNERAMELYEDNKDPEHNYVGDIISNKMRDKMNEIIKK